MTTYKISGTYGDTCHPLYAGKQFSELRYNYEDAKRIYKLYNTDKRKDVKLQMITSKGIAINIDPDKTDETDKTLQVILSIIIAIAVLIVAVCNVSLVWIVLGLVALVVWWLMFTFVAEIASPTVAIVLTVIAIGFLIAALAQ